ncbi:MAG TPA: hypothetical protein VNF07_08100 [Acidimicrobiales bacterium]|nr:hypothetical protein [Acidimicrobiales bacterium]
MDRTPSPHRTERRIVALSVGMSVAFGPLGLLAGRIPLLGGTSESAGRWIAFTAWFALYGLVMGLALAFAWRVENPALVARRRRRAREREDYWIGDWSTLLEEPPEGAALGAEERREPR